MLFRSNETAYEMCVGDWSSDVCSSDLFADSPSSLALLLGSVVLSIVGFVCAISGFIKERTRYGIILLILSSIAMAAMLSVFLIMLAMGA